MGPSRAYGPSVGSAEANGLREAHGARGHCSPLPPLSVALAVTPKRTGGQQSFNQSLTEALPLSYCRDD